MDAMEDPFAPPPNGYRTLIEKFPNGVLVLFDREFRYRIVGPDILPFSERPASSLIGKTIYELFPEETVDDLEPVFEATIAGDSRSIDTTFEGRVHHIETTPVEIDGEPCGVLVTQEVTEEREVAQRLQRQNERLDQFASMVSHDLRNPLSIARGKLSIFQKRGDDSLLDDVDAALERIDELTKDLLTVARVRDTEEYEAVSLEGVARQAWRMIDTKSATLETDDVVVSGDDGQLKALFENLFRNAIGHGGCDVTVRVGPLEDGFYVEDTGEGIPPDDREKVFDHGFTTGYGGSGVGLTIVSRIAENHGWDVTLGESPEGGARFEFQETKAYSL